MTTHAADAYELTPDWCINRLRVDGPEGDRAEFHHRARGRAWGTPGHAEESVLSFHALSPVPDDLGYRQGDTAGADEAEAGAAGVVARDPVDDDVALGSPLSLWLAEHWGTDREPAPGAECHLDGRALVYEFRTWGGAPEAWVEGVAASYPSLRFDLEFLNVAFAEAGLLRYAAGRLIERLAVPDLQACALFARARFGARLVFSDGRPAGPS